MCMYIHTQVNGVEKGKGENCYHLAILYPYLVGYEGVFGLVLQYIAGLGPGPGRWSGLGLKVRGDLWLFSRAGG